MKRFSLLLIMAAMISVSGCPNNCDLSQIRWAPTMDDVMSEPDINLLVFFRETGVLREGCSAPKENWEEIGRITDPEKIEKVMETLEEDSTVCEYKDECARPFLSSKWMGVVNKNKQGLLINIDFNHSKKRVEWWGRYSNRLYEILTEYRIIKPSN